MNLSPMSLNIWMTQVQCITWCLLASGYNECLIGDYIPIFRVSYFVFISSLKYFCCVSGVWTLCKL